MKATLLRNHHYMKYTYKFYIGKKNNRYLAIIIQIL